MSGIWIRAGRGAAPDPNLSFKKLADVRKALADVGVELWGWHVPFCANSTAAATEAANVLEWVDQAGLAGMVIDAERTNEHPRFQGTAKEAAALLVLGHGAERDLDTFQSDASLNRPIEGGIA